MFRRATMCLQAEAPKASKMQTLHKILLGEVQFKNKALVKACNVELMFGATWQAELEAYAKTLKAPEANILKRQVARLEMTRYTTAELAQFAGNGPQGVAVAAEGYMLCEGVGMLKAKGEAEFMNYVKAEAVNANWTDKMVADYVSKVKAAKASA